MSEIILTADIVLLAERGTQFDVLVIQRAHEPHAGRWALPGGYVDPGETFLQAAHRELIEETGLSVTALHRLDVYDDPNRDPRGRVITVAHLAILPSPITPTAGDDATAARWMPVDLDTLNALAFDHHQIVVDAITSATR